MICAGMDIAIKRPGVLATIRVGDDAIAMAGLFRFGTKNDLTSILKNAEITEIALDCPIYLPRKGRMWREEEKALWELGIPCLPPGGGYMPALYARAKEFLGLAGKPKAEGFATGSRGKHKVYEVYPHASFVMLSRAGSYGPLANKLSERGQLQRLLLLAEYIPNLGKDIWQKLDPDALDAVAAALTLYFIKTGKAKRLGNCLWVPEM
ncbi:MAG: DUF429 domain-containing protein [candidate division WOR-3 bacterium]